MPNRKGLLTESEVKRAKVLVRSRDGDKCWVCTRSGRSYRHEKHKDFDLDHVDHNPRNNPEDGSNWKLACHRCNSKRTPRGARKQPMFNGINRLKDYRKNKQERARERGWAGTEEWAWIRDRLMPAQMVKNKEAEPVFRRVVMMMVERYGTPTRKAVIDAASEAARISQQTGARYLDKMCSEWGELIYDEPEGKEMIVRMRTPEERILKGKP